MDELELFICTIQVPPVISIINFKQEWGVAPKTIAEKSDLIRLLGQKPRLANIFAGFLAYYSRRTKKCHATAISAKRSTSG